MKICVVGGLGRMGSLVREVTRTSERFEQRFEVASILDRTDGNISEPGLNGIKITDDVIDAFADIHGVVDFSAPAACCRTLPIAVDRGIPYLLASTGLAPEHYGTIDMAAKAIPLLVAANCSLGVNLLYGLVAKAAAALPDFDMEIFEIHHRHKRDAPSGTAKYLGEAVVEGRKEQGVAHTWGRVGLSEGRQKEEVGYAALRGGSVPGDHTVYLFGEDERLELTHQAQSPRIFAEGALSALGWWADKEADLYGMRDLFSF